MLSGGELGRKAPPSRKSKARLPGVAEPNGTRDKSSDPDVAATCSVMKHCSVFRPFLGGGIGLLQSWIEGGNCTPGQFQNGFGNLRKDNSYIMQVCEFCKFGWSKV